MGISYYIMMPFTWLLTFFYQTLNSYGLALILFALVVKVLLFPLSLKGKKSMIQMNMLSGEMQKLQKKYGKDQQRYQQEVQKLYDKEHVNPMGGCLWSLLPLFILLPLYAIIRQPLKYMMGLTPDQISAVAKSLDWGSVAVSNGWIREAAEFANVGYNQLYLSSLITPENLSAVQAAVGETAKALFPIDFSFFGTNLAMIPQLKFWVGGITVAAFGLFLIPVISAVTSIFFSLVSMKTNNINKQTENQQAAATNRTMMLITPLMSLWIGFSMPAALSIYWIANNVLSLGQELISGRLLKKDYEKAAEDAKRREIEEKEEEKRLRREKAEQRAREAEEARKNKAKKKEMASGEDKTTAEQKAASRVGMRQYARGRAYDPNRYGGVTPYHEDLEKRQSPAEEERTALQEESVPVVSEPELDVRLEELNTQLDAAIEDVSAAEDEPKED